MGKVLILLIYDKVSSPQKTAFLQAFSNRAPEGEAEDLLRSGEKGEWRNFDGCTIFRLRVWLIVRKIGKEEESGLLNRKKNVNHYHAIFIIVVNGGSDHIEGDEGSSSTSSKDYD